MKRPSAAAAATGVAADAEGADGGGDGGGSRLGDNRVTRWWSACCLKCPQRYVTAFMASLGFLLSFGVRCNMGVAIIRMRANVTTILPNGTNVTKPEFSWSDETIGLVDSSFFWGYMITQVPGGYMASRLPANRVFGCAIALSAFLNLFLPAACKAHYGAAMAVRILQGLVEGVTYPACHGIWRFWAPPLERSKLATIAFCGSYAGAVIGIPVSGLFTDYVSWEACFYFYGVLGVAWGVVWWFLSSERPATHPRITPAERVYIEESLGKADNTIVKFQHTPWKSIFTSMPVYAIIVANCCRSWTFYLLIINQVKYFTEVFEFRMSAGGILAALPHLVMATIVPLGGALADFLRTKKILSTTAVRKIFNCGGFGLEATFMLVVGYTRDCPTAIVMLIVAVGVSGFAITGFNVNHLDLAPRYASILMGLSNGIGTLSGILCPIATELLTKHGTVDEWEKVFLIAALIHYVGIVFYGIFASGEKQPWADPPEVTDGGCDKAKLGGDTYGSTVSADAAEKGGLLVSAAVAGVAGSRSESSADTSAGSGGGSDSEDQEEEEEEEQEEQEDGEQGDSGNELCEDDEDDGEDEEEEVEAGGGIAPQPAAPAAAARRQAVGRGAPGQ